MSFPGLIRAKPTQINLYRGRFGGLFVARPLRGAVALCASLVMYGDFHLELIHVGDPVGMGTLTRALRPRFEIKEKVA